MSTTHEYTIGQLAQHAGVTTRTIRYYVSEGLLPVPVTRGRYARYTSTHLQRLRLIKHLQQAFLPLAEIRMRLATLTDTEMQHVLEHATSSHSPPHAPSEKDREPMSPAPAPPLHTQPNTSAYQPAAIAQPGPPAIAHLAVHPSANAPLQFGYAAVYADPPATHPPAEARWRHLVLAPGIELHVREPHDPDRDQQIAALLERAQELFKGE